MTYMLEQTTRNRRTHGGTVGEQDEMEKPAKQWQVADIQKDIHQLDKKMDQLLETANSYVTRHELEESGKTSINFVTEQIVLLKAKYDPIYKLFWALITAVVIETAVLVLQFTYNRK